MTKTLFGSVVFVGCSIALADLPVSLPTPADYKVMVDGLERSFDDFRKAPSADKMKLLNSKIALIEDISKKTKKIAIEAGKI